MTINREKIKKIRELSAERDRLLALLDFYGWLEEHGLSWEQIKGLRPLDNTRTTQKEFKNSCRRTGRMDLWEKYNTADMVYAPNGFGRFNWYVYKPKIHEDKYPIVRRDHPYSGKFIDLKMKAGNNVILPWPPFPENVIYNDKKTRRS